LRDQLRQEVSKLFAEAPQSRKAEDLQEEFISNLCEKYDDLVTRGLSPEAALERVLNNIGDVSELITSLEEEMIMIDPEKEAALRKRNAMVVAGCVVFYVFAVVANFIMLELGVYAFISISIFLVLIAIPTAVLIYNFMSQPRYRRRDDTLVEEFKEFTENASRDKEAWKSLIGAYWCLVVVVYFAIGFFLHAWAWSWLIFILAAAVQNIVKAALALRK
jgi:magnesium-transporting ATPase (P-type)